MFSAKMIDSMDQVISAKRVHSDPTAVVITKAAMERHFSGEWAIIDNLYAGMIVGAEIVPIYIQDLPLVVTKWRDPLLDWEVGCV